MKRNTRAMEAAQNHNIPPCSVVVRRLTLGEISRMTISPFFIGNRCGQCKKFTYYGPKCTTCSVSYHYECALRRRTCCDLTILLHQDKTFESCSKCKQVVKFGPSCSVCKSKFHSYCLTPYNKCCRRNICQLPPPRFCGKCEKVVVLGPSCPICKNIYHLECSGKRISCCGFELVCNDDNYRYRCKRCHRTTSFGSPMCQLCGQVYHRYCIGVTKNCCGKPLPLEIFFISSFKFMVNYFKACNKWRTAHKQCQGASINHQCTLCNNPKSFNKQIRARKKSTSCQTSALDSITIVSVKSELEDKEMDISNSPPVLEREISCSPEPSSSNLHRPEADVDGDETLKNLFDFLYNMVRKFPPQLQTQVKIDLFKTVTEAEMKLRCNMIDELPLSKK